MPVKMVGNGSLTITYPFGSTNWDFSTTAFPSDVADAIDYAVNNGAHVINLSYGFNSMGGLANDVFLRVPLLYQAILNAYDHNVVVVASMGNEYNEGNPIEFPAFFRIVIAVGATTSNNPPSRWYGSNTGSHICVSAPGDNILSTLRGGSTGNKSGTSMAAPIVSGVAGLIISQGLDRNFNLTNDDVRHILERTADDITSTGIGFDNETGFGKVNAYRALSLLDTPNVLYHGVSTGGTSVKLNTINQWIYYGPQWGLASGMYYNVDQYQITKHITFDVPFCSVPQIWIRDRESTCLSFGNPNDGYPYAIITNITNTGFDVKYATYYVRYNSLGQAFNRWLPIEPSLTKIAYTAVGQPNPAAAAGQIQGPAMICSDPTYTIPNLSPDVPITWECGPELTISSGQNTATCTFSMTGNGSSWVKATLGSSCGNIIRYADVSVGNSPYTSYSLEISRPDGNPVYRDGEGNPYACPNTEYVFWLKWDKPYEATHDHVWIVPETWTINYNYDNLISVNTNNDPYNGVIVDASNSCGNNVHLDQFFDISPSCSNSYNYSLAFTPNPSNAQTTLIIKPNADKEIDDTTEWSLEIYDTMQNLKTKIQKLRGDRKIINTTGWRNGIYIVHAKINGEIIAGKLIIKN